jgi:ribosomal-protein-alanine N-acetyltransferase
MISGGGGEAGRDARNLPIEGERVVLRPFTIANLDVFRTIASREQVLEYLPESDRMTPEELAGVLRWLIRCYDTNTPLRIEKLSLAAVDRSSGEIVGWWGLGPLEFDESETEIYFVMSPEHWGRGLATESARALLEYALGELGLPRVVAVVDPENVASVRVVEKLGMHRERTVRGLSEAHGDYEGHSLYTAGRSREAGES